MLANEVRVVDAEPEGTGYVTAAEAVAAARAAAAAAVPAAPEKVSTGNCEEEEECAPAWDAQS